MPKRKNLLIKGIFLVVFTGVLVAGYFVYRYNFGSKLQKLVYRYDYVVANYNMGHGINPEGYYTIVNIAKFLRALSPDVVFLYDVDIGADRTFRDDQVRKIAAGLGMEYTFGRLERVDGGWNGFALLTKFPIVFSELRIREGEDGKIEAGILHVILEMNNRKVHFYSVYFKGDSLTFESSFRELMDLIVKRGMSRYMIISSNFVTEPSQKIINDFKYYFGDSRVKCLGECFNFPSTEPKKTLDFIFVGEGFSILDHKVIEAEICKSAGRYLPIICRVEMKPK